MPHAFVSIHSYCFLNVCCSFISFVTPLVQLFHSFNYLDYSTAYDEATML